MLLHSLIFFIIFTYLSYKAFIFSLYNLANNKSFNTSNDIANLIYNFPLQTNYIQQIPSEAIESIYRINGFTNYKDFIYSSSNDVKLLHSMLNYEPELSSRYSSFIVQDIINSNSREVAEIVEHFIKRVFKFSIPLGCLAFTLVGLNTIDPLSILS